VFGNHPAQQFSVHKQLVCTVSRYVDTVTKCDPSHDTFAVRGQPHIFKAFIQWLYARILPTELTQDEDDLCELYIIASQLECNRLKNFTIDRLQDILRERNGTLALNNIRLLFTIVLDVSNEPIARFCAALIAYELSTKESETKVGFRWAEPDLQALFTEVPKVLSAYLALQIELKDDNNVRVNHDPRVRASDGSGGYSKCYFHSPIPQAICTLEPSSGL